MLNEREAGAYEKGFAWRVRSFSSHQSVMTVQLKVGEYVQVVDSGEILLPKQRYPRPDQDPVTVRVSYHPIDGQQFENSGMHTMAFLRVSWTQQCEESQEGVCFGIRIKISNGLAITLEDKINTSQTSPFEYPLWAVYGVDPVDVQIL